MPVTFTNALGMSVSLLEYGATLTSLRVPDRAGALAEIVLGLPDEAAYRASPNRWGVMGPYAGRLTTPSGVVLHGGPAAFDKRDWARADFEDCCSLGTVFTLVAPPLSVELTYRLMKDENRLRLEYRAESSQMSALNLTNHFFVNLAGAGAEGFASHRVSIAADQVTETDSRNVPTGRLIAVSGPFDLREMRAIETAFDHSYLFSDRSPGLKEVVTLDEPASGRRMEIATTEPSLQFFTANVFDGSEMGAQGRPWRKHDGLAFETQHLPDSPNHADFPSTEIAPGQAFHSVTSYRFSVLP